MSAKTAFRAAVWSYVTKIPPGKVTTYGNIAKALGRPGASRGVWAGAQGVPQRGAVVACRAGRRPP